MQVKVLLLKTEQELFKKGPPSLKTEVRLIKGQYLTVS